MGGITFSHWWIQGRTLGASGLITKVVRAAEDPAAERASSAMAQKSPEELEAALMAATLAEMGDDFGAESIDGDVDPSGPEPDSAAPGDVTGRRMGPASAPAHIPLGANLLFFFTLMVGGFLSATLHGTWAPGRTLGAAYDAMVGAWPASLVPLVLGGAMVGFGTRMGSGCTSGHGLSGCSRFQPASLLATACFFGVAVAISFAMEAVAR